MDSIKVLYIEDDRSLANLFKKKLSRLGYDVYIEYGIGEYIESISNEDYSVIFLDNDLPGYSGIDILLQLKNMNIDIPVIIITGQGNEELAVEAMKNGASDYIVKDINLNFIDKIPQLITNAVEKFKLQKSNILMHKALEKSENSLKKAQEVAMLGNWEYKPSIDELYWSDQLYKIYDIEKDDRALIAEDFYSNVHPDDLEYVQREYQKHLETGDRFNITHRFMGSDGTQKFLRQICETEFDDIGNPIISYGIVQDITKEKEAEEKLKQLNSTMQIMIDSMPFSVIVVDKNRYIRIINTHAVELLGYNSKEEIVGLTCHDILCSDALHQCPIYDLGQSVDKTERELVNRSGEIIPILKSVVKINIENQEMLLESFVDISALKKTEQELLEAKEKAEEANRAKSMFLSSMSHEIRTPLNPIIGITEALIEKSESEEQKRLLKIINSSGKSLLELINDILDISKIESGQMEMETIPFDIIETIEHVCDICYLKAKEKNLDIITQFSRGVKRKLYGDPLRVKQIVLNLLSNAIKFTSEGELTVGCREIKEDDEKVQIELYVKDTGIGIPEDKLESIFEDFTQADSSTTREYGGTGLGLSISKKLSKLMNGSITVESSVGVGSKFTVQAELKKQRTEVDGENRYNRRASDHLGEEIQLYPNSHYKGEKKKVLLVDDSENNRLVVKVFLEDYAIIIDEAENGQVALEKMDGEHYDLVFMDISMPVMDGYDTIEELRRREMEGSIPQMSVIAMTAYAFSSDSELCITHGFSDYLAKPIVKSDFYKKLYHYLPEIFSKEDSKRGKVTPKLQLNIDPMLIDYVPQFLDSLDERLDLVRSELEQNNLTVVNNHIHAIKGNAGSYGLGHISDICREIEGFISDGWSERVGDRVTDISVYIDEVREYLKDQ